MSSSTWWSRLTSEDKSDEELNSNIYLVYLERLFKIRDRNTSIMREVKCGFSHFFSCSFILAVNPSLLQYAGFNPDRVAAATAISAGTSCIISGLLSNLPFVLAPTTSTSLYFALFLQNRNLQTKDGNFAVFILGFCLFLCGLRPVALFISNIIPFVIKVGICLGVGLLIALESLTEIGLVRKGERTVLDIGEFNAEIYIAMIAFVTIGIALHYRVRGAFLIGLVLGTVLYWLLTLSEGRGGTDVNYSDIFVGLNDLQLNFAGFSLSTVSRSTVYRLVFDLYVIGVILLNGLAHGLSEMAGLKRDDGTLPRGKWLYAACGIGTLLSSLLGSGPIMISPESAPGIKSGARTGLSAVVCGVLFLLSTILCPLFAKVPAAGTSPVLLMIGMMLFENAGKVNWSSVKEALPVFLMSVFIPFTYSIFNGVIFGFGIYCVLYVCTEENSFARITRKISRMAVNCCSCWRRGGVSGVVLPSQIKSGNDAGHSGTEYRSVLHDFDLSDENEERSDARGLTFELSEISNQYVGGPGGVEDDLVSIRLSHLQPSESSAQGSRNSSNSRSTSTGDERNLSFSAKTPLSSSSNAAPARSVEENPQSSSSSSFLQSVSSFWGGGNKSHYRSVNAGAGSLLSLIGRGGGDGTTPDWVLDSTSKL